VHGLARQFTQVADGLGDVRAGNMVMLGALLAIAQSLPQASMDAALKRLMKNAQRLDLDQRA
jgi:Pyruvate/2-oxoacid:ferredoxin oxidoreductase gamma subunit